jgi:hypothetical protein
MTKISHLGTILIIFLIQKIYVILIFMFNEIFNIVYAFCGKLKLMNN